MTWTMIDGPCGTVELREDGRLHDYFDSREECQMFLDRVARNNQVMEKLEEWARATAVDLALTYDEVLESVAHYDAHDLLWAHRHPGG